MELTEIIPDIMDTIPFTYQKIKSPEYDNIIQQFLKEAKVSNCPKIINMGGIPGAGKSTFYHNNKWLPHVLVDFDNIMENLPSYQKDINTIGNTESFKKWEITARIIGYEILRQAIEMRCNIFFDNGGLFSTYANLLSNIKKYNYSTEMHFINCDIETAFKRTAKREELLHRHTPRETIENRNQVVSDFISKYKNIIDNLYIYDNSNDDFKLMEKFSRSI